MSFQTNLCGVEAILVIKQIWRGTFQTNLCGVEATGAEMKQH